MGCGKGLVDHRILHGAEEDALEAIAQLGDGPRRVPKRMITVDVSDDLGGRTVEAIIKTNQTGNACDGKIFVLPTLEATRIRTGETVTGRSEPYLMLQEVPHERRKKNTRSPIINEKILAKYPPKMARKRGIWRT